MLLSVVMFVWGGSVFASPIVIPDDYIGADPTGGWDGKDIIGDDFRFDVSKTEVTNSGGNLIVDVYTTFLDDINYLGAELGDLFISTDAYNPVVPTDNDYYYNGEDWEYALVLDSHNSSGGGDLFLYTVDMGNRTVGDSNTGNIKLSDDYFSSPPFHYRQGQEVRIDVDVPSHDTGLTGSWSVYGLSSPGNSDDYLRFEIALSAFGDDVPRCFHWAPTCANDVIEGCIPDASALILLGSAMIGVGVFGRKKVFKKEA